MVNRTKYTTLANLFRYPSGDGFLRDVEACLLVLETDHPAAAETLRVFNEYMKGRDTDQRQELFTKTFDVQPICYLDLGYVMFGEDYKRGAFLLSMQGEQQKIGNDCGTELPDHICNVLTLMTISNDEIFLRELVAKILQPCLKKMIAEFAMARIDLKMKVLRKLHSAVIQEDLNHGNVYRNCFEALLIVLNDDFGAVEDIPTDEPSLHTAHHQSFFNKQQSLANNYKLD